MSGPMVAADTIHMSTFSPTAVYGAAGDEANCPAGAAAQTLSRMVAEQVTNLDGPNSVLRKATSKITNTAALQSKQQDAVLQLLAEALDNFDQDINQHAIQPNNALAIFCNTGRPPGRFHPQMRKSERGG